MRPRSTCSGEARVQGGMGQMGQPGHYGITAGKARRCLFLWPGRLCMEVCNSSRREGDLYK